MPEEIQIFIDLVKETYEEVKAWFDEHTWGYYVLFGLIGIAVVVIVITNPAVLLSFNCLMLAASPFAIIWFVLWNRKRQKDEATVVKPEPGKEKKKERKKRTTKKKEE